VDPHEPVLPARTNGGGEPATGRRSRVGFLLGRSPEEPGEWHEEGFITTAEYREALGKDERDPGS